MLMQNFGATNKEHYGMLWYFWSGQYRGLLSTYCHWIFYQLTDPVYSMDTHTYGAVLPFVRKSAFICVENQNGQ